MRDNVHFMENQTPPIKSESAGIRAEFDKILMRHISSLIDTRKDIAALPFNLATIACLLLLAERENEIRSFPESPPERYNRETFFTDIEEIGIDLDEDVLVAIQNLDQYGFVIINAKNQYNARESATLLISLLDAIFPQMPGMNLVAYVSQAIEEVISGRKELDHALQQFDQTLAKQGIRLSTLPKDRLPDNSANRTVSLQKPDPALLLERRATYLQRLKELRAQSLKSAGDPAIVNIRSRMQHIEIKELFPKKQDPLLPGEALDVDELSDSGHDVYDLSPESIPELTTAPDHVPHESIGMPDPPEAEEKPVDSVPEPESLDELSGEDPVDDFETETDLAQNLSREELIERKIRAFEEELAMPCPICGIGKVLSDTTEKGKTYYHCSNENCKLISWGKPYYLECPVCKNPFLIEFLDSNGQIGLKCPRATCLYRKKSTAQALSEELNGSGKKKVAVKRRRAVRRVVRKKS